MRGWVRAVGSLPQNGAMTKPVIKATTLSTADGVPIEAVHLPGPGSARTDPAVDHAPGGRLADESSANGRPAGSLSTGGPASSGRSIGFVVAHGFTQSWQRPAVWHVAERLNHHGGVVTFDFRGHGRSGGAATLGDKEIYDVAAAAHYLRELGYHHIVTVGFSMGASVVLRHAGLLGGVDAVVSVSGPGRWYYRGTPAMRRVHWVLEHKIGRLLAKHYLKTEIAKGGWDVIPMPPAEAAARIAPTPLLVVHGDRDAYFPADHAEQIFEAAQQPKELWIVPGLGHAEAAMTDALLDQIAAWAIAASTSSYQPAGNGIPSA